jgi:hypothetical protein
VYKALAIGKWHLRKTLLLPVGSSGGNEHDSWTQVAKSEGAKRISIIGI